MDLGKDEIEEFVLVMFIFGVRLEKLLTDAAEAALIRDLATDRRKRELFNRHLAMLAAVVEHAIATQALVPPLEHR